MLLVLHELCLASISPELLECGQMCVLNRTEMCWWRCPAIPVHLWYMCCPVAPAHTRGVTAAFEGFYLEEGGFFQELSPDLSLRETEKSHLWLMVLFKNWVGAAPVWIVNSAPNDWCQVWGVHIYCWWVMRHNAIPAAHCALSYPASVFELSSCGTSFYW